MSYLPQSTALVLIDVQKGLDDPSWGPINNPQAEENIARLLKAWRATSRPVFIYTSPLTPSGLTVAGRPCRQRDKRDRYARGGRAHHPERREQRVYRNRFGSSSPASESPDP